MGGRGAGGGQAGAKEFSSGIGCRICGWLLGGESDVCVCGSVGHSRESMAVVEGRSARLVGWEPEDHVGTQATDDNHQGVEQGGYEGVAHDHGGG